MQKSFRRILALAAVVAMAAFATAASAALTEQQVATLKAAATADPTAAALMSSADDVALAAWFNAPDPAGCIVWRPDVPISEANAAMVWTEVDTLTVGKARIWEWLRLVNTLDYRQASIRQGINDAFAGLTTRAQVINTGKRTATRAEKALSTGACTTLAPSLMTFYGSISFGDASLIRS